MRIDEPKLKTAPLYPRRRIGADAAPIAVEGAIVAPVPDRTEAPVNLIREGSHIVYSDSEQEVRKGFALALRVMGIEQSQ